MPFETSNSRIIIENVYPEINCGQYPVKRCIGDTLEVWADIFMDGHDELTAILSYQEPGETSWVEVPLKAVGNDRWNASFPLKQVGTYSFMIKAWPDRFGSWAHGTRKSFEAKQDIQLELGEGRALFESVVNSGAKRKLPDPHSKKIHATLTRGKSDEIRDLLLSDEAHELFRQHDPREGIASYEHVLKVQVDRKRAEFSAWYELFPRSQGSKANQSGTFVDCIRRLPDIKSMGFDVVYLPPIHPIGVAHRKGKNNALEAAPNDPGSPYAIGAKEGGHKAIHPELGTLDDFRKFVAAAKELDMEVALDFAVQVSRDHPYIKDHPEWFSFRSDGTLKYAENPPKKYQDIANVNFACGEALWKELESIVRFWIDQGVTIFRVDNPHTKPFAFWKWLIDSIRADRPDIIFLAEAFTRPKVMYHLAKAGFNQSYSYFTWRNTKQELIEYLTELTTDWPKDFFRPNFFPTTPDILPGYLQKSGRPGFITRLALAATLSGNYGMYSGYELCEADALPNSEEYANSEKYEFKVRDWNAKGNIKDFVRKLNTIRRENPALQQFKNLRFYPAQNDNVIFYGKMTDSKNNAVFIAVNLDYANTQDVAIELPLYEFGLPDNATVKLDDLLLGHSWQWTGKYQNLRLDPEKNPVIIFRMQRP